LGETEREVRSAALREIKRERALGCIERDKEGKAVQLH
jgi:hypothetical protein